MPLFEVECSSCKEVSEVLTKFGDPLVCPKCNSTEVKKLITLSNIYWGTTCPTASLGRPTISQIKKRRKK